MVLDEGARGYVIGNYAASSVVLIGLWLTAVRDHVGLPHGRAPLGPLLRYGGPTVPADAAVFLLNAVDRTYLLRAESPAAAGLVRGRRQARDGGHHRRARLPARVAAARLLADRGRRGRAVYARVTTAYLLVAGIAVAGFELLGRWVVRLLAAPVVLRGPRGAAVAGARLGALRPVPAARRRSPAALRVTIRDAAGGARRASR